MNARRPSPPRSTRAPAGRPDTPRPRSGQGAPSEAEPQREARQRATKGSPSVRSSRLQFRTSKDRTLSVSWRFLVSLVVATMAFVLVAPTLNLYFQQMEQVRTLNEQIDAAKERNAQLEREIEMWEDPDFIRSQARERLGYVLPGEQPWVVVDPEAIIGEEAQDAYLEENGFAVPIGPWYLEMWTSIETAGNTEPALDGRKIVTMTSEES